MLKVYIVYVDYFLRINSNALHARVTYIHLFQDAYAHNGVSAFKLDQANIIHTPYQ